MFIVGMIIIQDELGAMPLDFFKSLNILEYVWPVHLTAVSKVSSDE